MLSALTKETRHLAGVYIITNIVNGKIYVGSTKSFSRRFGEHNTDLRAGDAFSPHFQHAWNKYGEESFKFEIGLVCSKDKPTLRYYEQKVLDYLRPYDPDIGYNICKEAGPGCSYTPTPEHIAKSAASRTGQKRTPEARKRMSESHKGQVSWNKGRTASPETRAKQSAAQMGKKRSPEAVAKSVKSRTGVPSPLKGKPQSPEHLASRAAAQLRNPKKPLSEKTKAKISARHTGRKATPEARAAMAIAQQRRYAREKAAKQLEQPIQ